MTLKKFIKDNRKEIDEIIDGICSNNKYYNDESRREWIMNDEGLYNWARSEGVKI